MPLLEETLKLRKAKLGPDHPETLISMNNLADAYQAAGRLRRLATFRRDAQGANAKLGPEHPITLNSMTTLPRLTKMPTDCKTPSRLAA